MGALRVFLVVLAVVVTAGLASPATSAPWSPQHTHVHLIDIDTYLSSFTITCRTRLPLFGERLKPFLSHRLIMLPRGTKSYWAFPGSYDYVVDDNGTTADFNTIQDAVDAATDGDRIYVCPGSYDEQVAIDKEIELISLDGADTTTIDGGSVGDGTVVRVAASALVRGFTITGATSDLSCYYGGGIKITGSSGQSHNYVVIEQNKIIDNHSCKVGGIYVSGFGSTNGDHVSVTATIRNNIIARNDASTGQAGGISVNCDYSVDSIIENNVVASNSTTSSIGGIEQTDTGCTTDIRNNVVYGNTGVGIDTGDFIVEYNDSYDNGTDYSGGTGNINADPLFADAVDYRLDAASPCVDAGDPAGDYDDPDGTRNDMGAYGGEKGAW